jgi:branched-chain amino acid transport system substrate-binding protein
VTRQRSAVLGVLLALVAATAALAAVTTRASAAGKPILLGFVVDLSGNMSPFDAPALAAAQLEVAAINKKGGVGGRKLQIQVCNTQLNAAKAKSCAASMLDKGAAVLFVTCDVDYATPATQEALNRGVLAVAPCIGTDQMGPKRFGAKGKLAFSFGNVAQDEGAAMAEFAFSKKHWKTAVILTNNQLVYFKNVTAAFEKRYTQLGGKVVGHESYTTGDNTIQNVITRIFNEKSDALVTSTTFGELPALVQGLRALHDDRAIVNSWAGDGNYWFPKGVSISNYYDLTFASVFGDDPSAAVRSMIAKLKGEGKAPATGGFVTGAAAIDGVVAAIQKSGGSTDGAKLAAAMQGFKGVKTISGNVSFSAALHTVFGRAYRIMQVTDGKPHYVGSITASSPAKI